FIYPLASPSTPYRFAFLLTSRRRFASLNPYSFLFAPSFHPCPDPNRHQSLPASHRQAAPTPSPEDILLPGHPDFDYRTTLGRPFRTVTHCSRRLSELLVPPSEAQSANRLIETSNTA